MPYRARLATPSPEPPAVPPAYDDLDLDRMFVLGTDVHTVPTPLDRMVENVLDWEHLPFVHPENFCSTALIGSGPHWYRARVGSPPASRGVFNQVLVCVHPSKQRWFLTLESGPGAGLVFHAHTIRVEPQSIRVELTFYIPERPRNAAMSKAMFHVYRDKLRLLYAQDIAMASERQQALDRRASAVCEPRPGEALGTVDEVMARAPFLVTVSGRRAWVRYQDGALSTFSADCPHMSALLPCPHVGQVEVACPWHDYRFDVGTGRSADGRGLRIPEPPALEIRDGMVWLAAP